MLSVQLDEADGVAIVQSQGELSASDFESAAKIIDPYQDFGVYQIGDVYARS